MLTQAVAGTNSSRCIDTSKARTRRPESPTWMPLMELEKPLLRSDGNSDSRHEHIEAHMTYPFVKMNDDLMTIH
jgi:hypothetical protein